MIHFFEKGGSDITLLLLHGTGGDEHQIVPLARQMAPDANLLSFRGEVSEHGNLRFFARFEDGSFDWEDLRARVAELAAEIDAAVEKYQIDRSKMVAVGYSNGANTAAALWYLYPESVRHAIFLRPMAMMDEKPDLSGHSGLVLVGATDNVCSPREGLAMADSFLALGATVETVAIPAAHNLIRQDAEEASNFIDRLR